MFLLTFNPFIPVACFFLSVKANWGWWQDEHEIVESLLNIGSKKSFFPSSILASVSWLFSGIYGLGNPEGKKYS